MATGYVPHLCFENRVKGSLELAECAEGEFEARLTTAAPNRRVVVRFGLLQDALWNFRRYVNSGWPPGLETNHQ